MIIGDAQVPAPAAPGGESRVREADVILAQRTLVEKLIGREAREPRVFWYYTPMAMAFSSDSRVMKRRAFTPW